jgi:hypothetical protein
MHDRRMAAIHGSGESIRDPSGPVLKAGGPTHRLCPPVLPTKALARRGPYRRMVPPIFGRTNRLVDRAAEHVHWALDGLVTIGHRSLRPKRLVGRRGEVGVG